jgi:hypothetical protein
MQGSVLTEEKIQSYQLEDGVTIQEIPKGARQVEVWVPFMQSDESQRVLGVEVDAPFPLALHYDREWGNAILYGHLPAPKEAAISLNRPWCPETGIQGRWSPHRQPD